MTRSVPVGEVRPLGDRAFLIGVADAAAARTLAGELAPALTPDAEVVSGAATVMVHATAADAALGPMLELAAVVGEELRRRPPSGPAVEAGRVVTIPCRFDGPDLEEVAALAEQHHDEVGPLGNLGAVAAFDTGPLELLGEVLLDAGDHAALG